MDSINLCTEPISKELKQGVNMEGNGNNLALYTAANSYLPKGHLLPCVVDPSPSRAELLICQIELGWIYRRFLYSPDYLLQLHVRERDR